MDFVSCEKKKDVFNLDVIISDYLNGTLKAGDEVSFKAYVYSTRVKKWGGFVLVRTNRTVFQCVADDVNVGCGLNSLKDESYVIISGIIVDNNTCKINPGFEIKILNVSILSAPLDTVPFPINKDFLKLGDDLLFDNRALTMRNPRQRSIFRVVSEVLYAFRTFLRDEGFTEFIAPKIVQAGAEGGADMFELDYFGQKAYLAQSPQQYKQLMVGVFGKAYTLSPVFRAEKFSTNRHINEFQGLDLEMSINSMDDLLELESRMMCYIYKMVNKTCREDLNCLGVELKEFTSIPRIRFTDAKAIVAQEYNRPINDRNDLEPEEERLIGRYFREKYNSEFVFITGYPTVKRPFYTKEEDNNPNYTLSYDLLLNGAEITTGGQRINDYVEQVNKMNRLGMNIDDFSDYLLMHKYCLPPHGGMGIGLERLVMRMLNLDNIKYATAFPRDRDRLNP